jgi:hypothetical protein
VLVCECASPCQIPCLLEPFPVLSLSLSPSSQFLKMSPRELVDHIRSGPAKLMLDKPLRFRRRTRSNPCDFNEFIQALKSSMTIKFSVCWPHTDLEITEDEWVLLVETLGSIKGIEDLTLICKAGCRNFDPFQAVAHAVENAHSLYKLELAMTSNETFPIDASGLNALANALREHTVLQGFTWVDKTSREFPFSLDPVLWTLSACPHLLNVVIITKCASVDAMKNLMRLRPATKLRLVVDPEKWLALADEIRLGHCNIRILSLGMQRRTMVEATDAVKGVASAIQLDHNLEHLTLTMENVFTDEGCVALAEALTVNKSLRNITLCTSVGPSHEATLGTLAYLAFGAMLRVNTNITLKVPTLHCTGGDPQELLDSYNQMIIEQRLNQVGRGRLLASSNHTTTEQWVDALLELEFNVADDFPAFQVSCLYSLLRSHPDICILRVDDTSDSGE